MELYQLRTFVIVAEEKNVTKAAKRLFTTPPSVSAHIKALEEELNVALFTRTSKGMKITEQGEILRQKAEQTLLAAQDLANHATRLREHLIGRLNFGINATPTFLRLGPLVKQLREKSPGLELNITSADTGLILEGLSEGRLEAGYIFGHSPNPNLTTRRLHTANLVITAPYAWTNRIESASWEKIAALPWVASTHYCPFQVITDDLFKQQGLILEQVVQSSDETTKYELVKAGVGLALLESSEAEQGVNNNAVVIWETAEAIQCDLSLAYLTKNRDNPLIQALETILVEIW